SRHRVTTSQVVRPSVGLSNSKPSKPSWSSTAPARAANRWASSSPLSGSTVIALILITLMSAMMPPGHNWLPGGWIARARMTRVQILASGGDVPVDGIAGWAVGLMEQLGVFGAGLAVALENLFPPLPSEI